MSQRWWRRRDRWDRVEREQAEIANLVGGGTGLVEAFTRRGQPVCTSCWAPGDLACLQPGADPCTMCGQPLHGNGGNEKK